jgi:hypothetical protein
MNTKLVSISAFVLIALPLWIIASNTKPALAPGMGGVAGVGLVNTFANATSTNIVCKNGTSTVVIASSTNLGAANQRLSFTATYATGTTPINVCEGDSCAAFTGVTITPSSSIVYQLLDNYAGSVSCIGDTATATLSYTFIQF